MTRRTELAAQAAAATAVLLVLAAGSLVTRHRSEHQATDAPVAARAGPRLLVKSVHIESHPEGVWVYNCTVEGDHTF